MFTNIRNVSHIISIKVAVVFLILIFIIALGQIRGMLGLVIALTTKVCRFVISCEMLLGLTRNVASDKVYFAVLQGGSFPLSNDSTPLIAIILLLSYAGGNLLLENVVLTNPINLWKDRLEPSWDSSGFVLLMRIETQVCPRL